MKAIVVGATALVSSFVFGGCASETPDSGELLNASTDVGEATAAYSGEATVSESGQGQGYGNVPYTLNPGLFGVRGGAYGYSSGSAFCIFGSWQDFTASTGRSNVNGIWVYDGMPQGMANHGTCPLRVGAGFFNAGYGFYSNGDHYCACDHSAPRGRVVHRRPDMPFDGSCGGC